MGIPRPFRAIFILFLVGISGCSMGPNPPGQTRELFQGGTAVSLEAGIFSPAHGRQGYWHPQKLYRRVGANIYFLDPYDPHRIPVLFVHGAGGAPRDWRYLVSHLDASRYQPWLFYYPSGDYVESSAHLLAGTLRDLAARYPFKNLYIVAHSLGGLVVRFSLGHFQDAFPSVKLFVSISTPWGGEDLATLAPPWRPNWEDMKPRGSLLRSLFASKLPPELHYYLFFGFKGRRGLVRPVNDGAVTLASELEPRAQAEARRLYGFNESHTSILSSPEVAAALNGLLHQTDQQLTREGEPPA